MRVPDFNRTPATRKNKVQHVIELIFSPNFEMNYKNYTFV